MSFIDRLRKDKMTAMKEKDPVKNGVLGLLISPMVLYEKENKVTISDEEALTFIQKELKQTKETLATTPSNRLDLIEETKKKIEIIESYLPKQMTLEEVKTALNELINEKGIEISVKNKGMMIKEMMAKYKGVTDGKTVNAAVAEILK